MSIIALRGYKRTDTGERQISIAWDSCTFRGNNTFDIQTPDKVLCFQNKKCEFIFGNVGYSKRTSLMKAYIEKSKSPKNFLPILNSQNKVFAFMEQFYEYSEHYIKLDHSLRNVKEEEEEFKGKSLLISRIENEVFIWYFNDFNVSLISEDGFFAIGSGRAAALGAMHSNANPNGAVLAACMVDKGCREPVNLKTIVYQCKRTKESSIS